ncbi:MAG: 30S ribosomal protein S3 [Candidatus Aureabacteria bacterium]|nr:30S ribosomal protein S3 [Candidatus Auribacterota bacterium]
MGQKTHPIGFRLGYNKDWSSRWFLDKGLFAKTLKEDLDLRKFILKKLEFGGIPVIDIERASDRIRMILYTSRPGVVIGRRGSEIDKLKEEISTKTKKEVAIDIVEIKNPDVNAQLVAENIALQLERRVSFRRALKRAIQVAMQNGAEGIKVKISGRIGGAEIARQEGYSQGRVPLQTLRADIDYGFAEARTTYGLIGCKVWICLGERTVKRIESEVPHGAHA